MSVPVTRPTTVMAGATLVESKDGFPAIYKLQQTVLSESKLKAGAGCIRKVLVGQENPEARAKRDLNVLLVGATGSGKTTLLNGFANYLHCVKFEDTFRYKLVVESDEGGPKRTGNQEHSRTDSVTAYRFDWQPWFPVTCNVVIIDTPGFGGSFEDDLLLVNKIEEFVWSETIGIDSLRVLAFVAYSCKSHIYPEDRYVIERVQSLFGNDVEDNWAIMATFNACDDWENLRNAVKAAHIEIREFFGFDNQALFCQNVDDEDEYGEDWKILCRSYREFFSAVQKFPEISLTKIRRLRRDVMSLVNTKEVLQRRQKLEDVLRELQGKIKEAENVRSQVQNQKDLLVTYERRKRDNSDWQVWQDESKWEQIPVEDPSHLVTWEYVKKGRWVKKSEVEDAYNKAVREYGSCEAKLRDLRRKFGEEWEKARHYFGEFVACLDELNKKALRKSVGTARDFFKMRIQYLEQRKPNGWERERQLYQDAVALDELNERISEAKGTSQGKAAIDRLLDQFFDRQSID